MEMLQKIRTQLINSTIDNGYDSFFVKYNAYYYGKNKQGNFLFAVPCVNNLTTFFSQSTKYLIFHKNVKCCSEKNEEFLADIIECTSHDDIYVNSFFEITSSYNSSSHSLLEYFLALKDLFNGSVKITQNELQGIYGELFFMHFFVKKKLSFKIYNFWQTEQKMKFDFSISQSKKIEVKTTLSKNRIHEFSHGQLFISPENTVIVSVMLLKDDCGLSLFDLANICKKESHDFPTAQLNINNLLLNVPESDLKRIKFNKEYTENNIKFFRAVSVPRFTIEEPIGVSNTKFSSDLTNSISDVDLEFILGWINS